jgi:hypothetical protein
MRLQVRQSGGFTAPTLRPLEGVNVGPVDSGVDAYLGGVTAGQRIAGPLSDVVLNIAQDNSPRAKEQREAEARRLALDEKRLDLGNKQLQAEIDKLSVPKLPSVKTETVGSSLANLVQDPVTGEWKMGSEIAKIPQEPKKRDIRPGGDGSFVEVTDTGIAPVYTPPAKPEPKIPEGLRPTKFTDKDSGITYEPETSKPSKGQDAVDNAFAKEYVEFAARGGYADVQKSLEQLKEASAALKSGRELTGPIVGRTPEIIKGLVNPQSIANREAVEEVVQRNLRLVLGAQFTQKEGERLIARAYNPNLDEAENAKRVDRLIKQIDAAAQAKQSAADYFEENGTLTGWKGKVPTIEDFNPESDGEPQAQSEPATNQVGAVDIVTVSSPEEAAALPPGTRFKTPDGRVITRGK